MDGQTPLSELLARLLSQGNKFVKKNYSNTKLLILVQNKTAFRKHHIVKSYMIMSNNLNINIQYIHAHRLDIKTIRFSVLHKVNIVLMSKLHITQHNTCIFSESRKKNLD